MFLNDFLVFNIEYFNIDINIGCTGSLTLLAEDSLGKVLSMRLTPAHFARRKRRKIKKIQKGTEKIIRFDKAKLEGNCCWKIWNRYRAGESILLSTSRTFEPGWRIMSVEMVKDCNFK